MVRQFCAALIAFVLLMLGSLTSAEAATVTLQWDSNRESDLAGYTISYGTVSHQHSSSVDVGNHTSYQFPDLAVGRTYYFAVRAYNSAGLQSALSSEVTTTTPVVPLELTNFMANLNSPRALGTSVISRPHQAAAARRISTNGSCLTEPR